jgi:hypothetical protein
MSSPYSFAVTGGYDTRKLIGLSLLSVVTNVDTIVVPNNELNAQNIKLSGITNLSNTVISNFEAWVVRSISMSRVRS